MHLMTSLDSLLIYLLDGRTAAIGTIFNDGNGSDSGHVQVNTFHPNGA